MTSVPHVTEQRYADPSVVPASRREWSFALAVVLLSTAAFAVVAPFARVPLPKLAAFIPSVESVLAINDFITAVLLFGQCVQQRSRALLVLACGYLFCALITVAHALSFPGGFRYLTKPIKVAEFMAAVDVDLAFLKKNAAASK